MTFDQARAKCRNRSAFSPGEKWMVLNSLTGEPLEGAISEARAMQAAGWVNDHEVRCGRKPVYVVEALT